MNARFVLRVTGALMLAGSMTAIAHAQTDRQTSDDQTARTLPLSLDDAVLRAIDNNPDLAVVRLGVDVEAARVSESRSAFSPVFSTTFGRSSNATPPSNLLLGDQGVTVNA